MYAAFCVPYLLLQQPEHVQFRRIPQISGPVFPSSRTSLACTESINTSLSIALQVYDRYLTFALADLHAESVHQCEEVRDLRI